MTETPIAALHEHGVTWHQTNPLKKAGHTTAEAVAGLVVEYRLDPDGSRLAGITGMGQRRIDLVCAAVDSWAGNRH